MSILSTLGNIVGFLPFPGSNLIGKGLSAAGDIGTVLGGQQGGKNNAKLAQGGLNQQQDQNALANYIAQQNAQNTAANTDLQRKQFTTQDRSSTAKQALIGALLGGGIKPTSISGGKASGGLLQSLNGNQDALAAMKLLGQQGSQAQNTPLQFQGGNMIAPPKLTPPQKLDEGNSFLSILSQIGQIGGALGRNMPQGQPAAGQQYAPEVISGLPFGMPGEDTGIPEAPEQMTGAQARAAELLRNVRL